MPHDPELLTRHEVHALPPDVLVTNYSMLEYMLMRPLERPVFDRTKDWLRENPGESFLLVIDEAHLYRGAAGTEVALLVRRLRTRLGIPPERLQVICTSASFESEEAAKRFGAQLTGKSIEDFDSVVGQLRLREPAAVGSADEAARLASVDLDDFYSATSDDRRRDAVSDFLEYRGVSTKELGPALFEALDSFSPLSRSARRRLQLLHEVWPNRADCAPWRRCRFCTSQAFSRSA